MSHLLNCPFCGTTPELVVLGVSAWVQCQSPNCGVSPGTKSFDSDEILEAIDTWNRRAPSAEEQS